MSLKFTSVPPKRLAASITSSGLVAKLNNIEGWDGDDLTSSDFGTEGFGVFRTAANDSIEFFKWDPSTIGVGTTTGITITTRGLEFTGDTSTSVAAHKLDWIKNETIVELGSHVSQVFQWLKEYIDAIAIAGAPDASDTTKGLTEIGTQTEVDEKDDSGGTTAPVVVTPSKLRATKFHDYVLDTGAADAYAIAPSPAVTAYAAGQVFVFKAANTNTTTSTLNVNSLGVKTIKSLRGAALTAGEIRSGAVYAVVYDGTDFRIMYERLTGLLAKQTAGVAISNTTTKTDVLTMTLPGGTLGPNDVIKFDGGIVNWNTGGGGETIVIRVELGASTLAAITLTSSEAFSGAQGYIFGKIMAINATNSQRGFIGGFCGFGSADDATPGESGAMRANQGAGSIDTTSDQTLRITCQWGAAGASNTVSLDGFSFEIVRI